MKRRLVSALIFTFAATGFYYLGVTDLWKVKLSVDHTLWEFLSVACVVLALQQLATILIHLCVRWKGGPEGESKMLAGFTGVVAFLTIIGAFIYSMGMLKAIGMVAAGFAGMLLGWSLQAPVSGIAAWTMVTLKRPFRVGDRVLFPSLGLSGDVKQVGLMYTVLDQVGGAIGSEEAIGRDILIPNAMLFTQVAINYTPKAQEAFFLDEVVIRMTYDSDWDEAEKILLDAAHEVTADIIRETGKEPYIRSDMWDYGILMRLRYMTMAKDRPRITHEIVKAILNNVQQHPRVDIAIPFVYSYRKSTAGTIRGQFPKPPDTIREISVDEIEKDDILLSSTMEGTVETDTLIKNIQEKGLLQPIVVSPTGTGRFRIVAGHKRFLACKCLGWKTVPVIIYEDSTVA